LTNISYIYEGLPHCHLVLQLTDVANIDDQEAIARFIDRHITAEAPGPEPTSMHPDDVQDHEIYRKLVEICYTDVIRRAREGAWAKTVFANVGTKQTERSRKPTLTRERVSSIQKETACGL